MFLLHTEYMKQDARQFCIEAAQNPTDVKGISCRFFVVLLSHVMCILLFDIM